MRKLLMDNRNRVMHTQDEFSRVIEKTRERSFIWRKIARPIRDQVDTIVYPIFDTMREIE